jgi:hypothetical protein
MAAGLSRGRTSCRNATHRPLLVTVPSWPWCTSALCGERPQRHDGGMVSPLELVSGRDGGIGRNAPFSRRYRGERDHRFEKQRRCRGARSTPAPGSRGIRDQQLARQRRSGEEPSISSAHLRGKARLGSNRLGQRRIQLLERRAGRLWQLAVHEADHPQGRHAGGCHEPSGARRGEGTGAGWARDRERGRRRRRGGRPVPLPAGHAEEQPKRAGAELLHGEAGVLIRRLWHTRVRHPRQRHRSVGEADVGAEDALRDAARPTRARASVVP